MEMRSSPDEYESISDADNMQMNQLGSDPVTVLKSIEGDDDEEYRKKVELNVDITLVNDSTNNSASEAHSLVATGEIYSSLKDRQIHVTPDQPSLYRQLSGQAII